MPDRDEAAREGYAIFSQEIKDDFGLNMAYMNMARIAAENGNESEKRMYMEKLKKEMRAAPASFLMGSFHYITGKDEYAHGNFTEAKKIFTEAEALFKSMRNVKYRAAMRSEIGHVERLSGNLSEAKAIYRETIKIWQDQGYRPALAHELECFGFIAIAEEQTERASCLLGAAEALRESCHSPMADEERVEYDRWVARLRGKLTGADFDSAWAQGRSMIIEQAVALAREEEKA
jgi:tetratricopeptide (TPR) repeat protein